MVIVQGYIPLEYKFKLARSVILLSLSWETDFNQISRKNASYAENQIKRIKFQLKAHNFEATVRQNFINMLYLVKD